ncbi:MAG: ATP:cob(I)alamin adenosyltransferase, partial [Verrucomicrobia bacterium]|nr:ATP:cob(I)alamin adenosyltransferase [Verrucomicrobiota bacterium]
MSRSIATRTGDDGSTSLLYGQRVPKNHPQIEAVGACDELNVALGAVKPHLTPATPRDAAVLALLLRVQKNLVAIMGELACAETDAARYAASQFEKLTEPDLTRLDGAVATLET